MLKTPVEIEQFLPFGEMLRSFLQQSTVPKGDLVQVLRSRGVFTASSEKDSTIPILVSTLLSPDEFEKLRLTCSRKEDTPKINTQTIPWQSDVSLIEAFPENLWSGLEQEFEFANYKLTKASNVTTIDGNEDHVKVDFEIERTDTSKSWSETTSVFPGSIVLKKILEGDKVRLVISYTAPETQKVAKKALSSVVKHFKNNGHVNHDDSVDKVLFSSFSNAERVAFLLALTSELASDVLEFREIIDISISPVATEDMPESMYWIEEQIRDLRLRGRELQNTKILRDADCHEFVQLHSIVASFAFDVRGATGACRISVAFPKFVSKGDLNSELEVKVEDVHPESMGKDTNTSTLTNLILEEMQDGVQKLYAVNKETTRLSGAP